MGIKNKFIAGFICGLVIFFILGAAYVHTLIPGTANNTLLDGSTNVILVFGAGNLATSNSLKVADITGVAAMTNSLLGSNDNRNITFSGNLISSGVNTFGNTALTNGGSLPYISTATNTLVLGAPSMVILRSNAWVALNLTNSLNPGDGYMWNSNGSLYWISRGISGAANLKTNQIALGP